MSEVNANERQVLDHGYVRKVDSWGDEESIIEAARMSTGKGFLGWGPNAVCAKCGEVWWVLSGELQEACRIHGYTEALRAHAQGYVMGALAGSATGPDRCPHCGHLEHEVKTGDEKLLAYLWKNKHHTPFEMGGLTFEVQAPIFVFREWMRHRVPFSYNELSARYTPLPDVNYIPTIERLMMGSDGKNKQAGTVAGAAVLTEDGAKAFQQDLRATYRELQLLYDAALNRGVPKELARVHLPVGRYSRMRVSSNLRGWLNFLRLRSDLNPGAQWEIRQFGNAVAEFVNELFPRTYSLFTNKEAT